MIELNIQDYCQGCPMFNARTDKMYANNVMLNYEVLVNIYKSRKNHKLDEWREVCKWIESLPYSELITGEEIHE